MDLGKTLFIMSFVSVLLGLIALTARGRIDLQRSYAYAVALLGVATLVGVMLGVDLPWWARGGGILNRAKSVPCAAGMLVSVLWILSVATRGRRNG